MEKDRYKPYHNNLISQLQSKLSHNVTHDVKEHYYFLIVDGMSKTCTCIPMTGHARKTFCETINAPFWIEIDDTTGIAHRKDNDIVLGLKKTMR